MAGSRNTAPVVLAGIVTTNTSTALTAPAGTFGTQDVGRTIVGAGIPAAATLTAAGGTNGTLATLSAAATASATVPVTLGPGNPASYGFSGYSPETNAEAASYKINSGVTPPDVITVAGGPKAAYRQHP